MTGPAQNLRAAGDRIEALVEELHDTADPRMYARVEELLRLVTDLYGAGLATVMGLAARDSPDLVGTLAGDELVASLLLVHGLHPDSLEQRVNGALERVRPLLATHGGDVELLEIDPDAAAVRLRLAGNCDGCPSSALTLQSAVETAILEAAPEILIIDVDQPLQGTAVTIGPKPGTDRGRGSAPRPVFESCPAETALP
jgi:Fe-S cluster biogenesis protein NfuA